MSFSVGNNCNNIQMNKAIYGGEDRRVNMHKLGDLDLNPEFEEKVKEKAKSVACMTKITLLDKYRNDTNEVFYRLSDQVQTLAQSKLEQLDWPLKNGTRFTDEPCLGFGTAFLVGEDLVLTASHCVTQYDYPYQLEPIDVLDRIRFVFGFQKTKANMQKEEYVFKKEDVYKIKKVVAFEYSKYSSFLDVMLDGVKENTSKADWALIKLNRPVIGREPLSVNFVNFSDPSQYWNQMLNKDDNVFMLGHPSGLPLKFSWGAKVKKIRHDNFEADLDAFAGNSGSPSFHKKTLNIVGILFKGNRDYEVIDDKENQGKKVVVVSSVKKSTIKERGYEFCQKTESLDFVKLYFQNKADKLMGIERSDVQNALGEYYIRGALKVSEFFQLSTSDKPVLFPSESGQQNFYERKAFKYFQKSQKNHYRYSYYNLAVCYFKGIGTEKDVVKAYSNFYSAEALCDNRAYYHLHDCYQEMNFAKKYHNDSKALENHRIQERHYKKKKNEMHDDSCTIS